MQPITTFPKGTVIGSVRLARGQHFIDMTRVKLGSRTRFIERVTYGTRDGPQQTALRQTDELPSDAIADRFIAQWIDGMLSNRGYRILYMDETFGGLRGHTQSG